MSDHAGLARPRARKHQQRPAAMRRCFALRRIELTEIDHGSLTLRGDARHVNARATLPVVDRYDTLVSVLRAEIPGFRIVRKDRSALHRAIHVALTMLTLGRMRSYLDGYQTTLGRTLYVTADWDQQDPDERYVTLRHEAVHLRQFRQLSFPVMALLYLLVPLPLGLAYCRARLEWAAYAETIRAAAEVWGAEHPRHPEFREHVVSQFLGPSYGWMWPFRAQVERWYARALDTVQLT
jgi:hypothetical protein